VQNAVCDAFQSAECSVEVSPELTEPPFNFAFHALGKVIRLLPHGAAVPKEFYQVSSISVRYSASILIFRARNML
ncbi:unnamed protein product, partial [Gongylonema pulchrum]|uniref:Mediator of RNA polymerase II transcription subunit 20 n=1 Tax=Gongylonema pulchrum TaxID=637853 RepID=A0A183D6D7_9BILA